MDLYHSLEMKTTGLNIQINNTMTRKHIVILWIVGRPVSHPRDVFSAHRLLLPNDGHCGQRGVGASHGSAESHTLDKCPRGPFKSESLFPYKYFTAVLHDVFWNSFRFGLFQLEPQQLNSTKPLSNQIVGVHHLCPTLLVHHQSSSVQPWGSKGWEGIACVKCVACMLGTEVLYLVQVDASL